MSGEVGLISGTLILLSGLPLWSFPLTAVIYDWMFWYTSKQITPQRLFVGEGIPVPASIG
jgi:hypothetical protein